jgi:hypothetical protein
MVFQIKLIGTLFILLSLLHIFLPKRFNWKNELGALGLFNRQLMQVHFFFIAFGLLLLGLLCLTSADALLITPLGRRICLGLGLFWTVRLYVQFFVYSSRLWRGKLFETIMHVVLAVFWAYAGGVFSLGFFLNYQ